MKNFSPLHRPIQARGGAFQYRMLPLWRGFLWDRALWWSPEIFWKNGNAGNDWTKWSCYGSSLWG